MVGREINSGKRGTDPMDDLRIRMEDILQAQKNIQSVARVTPMNPALGSMLGKKNIYFKLENRQLTGSFKIRGALNKISHLTESEKKRGVIAASAGNHAQGVAMSARLFGVQSKIVMPHSAPLIKISSTKSYGAEVILFGHVFDESYNKALEIARDEKRVFVHPYEDRFVIAGQGTIGLEILEALANVKSIVIPIGGGGLISGIAFAVKQLNPKCKIYGVVSNQTPAMMNLKKGREKEQNVSPFVSTIADGIAVKKPSSRIFDLFIDPLVDDIVAVHDEDIAQAIVYAMEVEKVILEGSGAAGLAAVLKGYFKKLEEPTCVLLCGGNIDLNVIGNIIDTGLRQSGRLVRLSVIVNDLPGELAALTKDFAETRANVLDVIHDRVNSHISLRQTKIDFLLETMGFHHIEEIREKIRQRNIRILEEVTDHACIPGN